MAVKIPNRKEVMLARVMVAHKRAKKLEDELGLIADDVRGTGLWVPAYERVMDARNIRVWLAGYLDTLKQMQ